MKTTDVLIIGSGIAGASAALKLAKDPARRIILITREPDPRESNSRYAQGGIVHRGPGDSPELLVRDILEAGAGASLPEAAQIVAEEGPLRLKQLLLTEAAVGFDRDSSGELAFGQEAAHSRRRILHVGDGTGRSIMESLTEALRRQPNIELLTNATAVDLITYPHHSRNPLDTYRPITCYGAYVFDRNGKAIHRTLARATILATGGLGRIYRNTTNPPGARGDGLAMAHRAGARIINAEYIQFHPTALEVPGAQGFLISEAVRGEGGTLLTPAGQPFMQKYSPEWKDLAARDVVARAIHTEMESSGYPYVLLDIGSHMRAEQLRTRFPNIYAECLRVGIDITREPIPVVPAAHYSCGGVAVNSASQTTIQNLYAVGEVACTGLHGANRLASTSLLEGLVFGERAAEHILAQDVLRASSGLSPQNLLPQADDIPPWDESDLTHDSDPALIQGDMQTIQNVMWHYVGLIRSGDRLSRAIRELRHLQNEIETFYRKTKLSDGLIGLRNAVETALVIAQAARHNRQSRGCHYRTDSVNGGDRLL
ncbi:MAG: L-aspartate oxidase [Anaerolineales bacterium]|jgi:L-aspartate oxidase|nr:L-aspartate oxidase [Anaerolineales bacterium]